MESFNYEPRQSVAASPSMATPAAKADGTSRLIYVSLGLNLLVVVALVAVLLRPAPSPQPGPGPGPTPNVISEDVASMVVEAERNLATYEAEISEQLADAVLKGTIKDSKQFYAMASAATDKAEDKAYAEVNKINQKYIGAEKWDAQLIAALQKLKAQGKRMVAK